MLGLPIGTVVWGRLNDLFSLSGLCGLKVAQTVVSGLTLPGVSLIITAGGYEECAVHTPMGSLGTPYCAASSDCACVCVCVWWGEPLLCLLCCDTQDHCKGLGTGTLAGSLSATGPTSRVVPANGWIAVSGLNQKA